jgi:hypothetical protein
MTELDAPGLVHGDSTIRAVTAGSDGRELRDSAARAACPHHIGLASTASFTDQAAWWPAARSYGGHVLRHPDLRRMAGDRFSPFGRQSGIARQFLQDLPASHLVPTVTGL